MFLNMLFCNHFVEWLRNRCIIQYYCYLLIDNHVWCTFLNVEKITRKNVLFIVIEFEQRNFDFVHANSKFDSIRLQKSSQTRQNLTIVFDFLFNDYYTIKSSKQMIYCVCKIFIVKTIIDDEIVTWQLLRSSYLLK